MFKFFQFPSSPVRDTDTSIDTDTDTDIDIDIDIDMQTETETSTKSISCEQEQLCTHTHSGAQAKTQRHRDTETQLATNPMSPHTPFSHTPDLVLARAALNSANTDVLFPAFNCSVDASFLPMCV